jgi:hypothetical protein
MKSLFSVVIFLSVFGLSLCHKETDHYQSEGSISGPDLRDCVCCGGWYIKIDSVEYEFEYLPVNSNIDLQTERFPIQVRLDWKLSDKPACPLNKIIILRIKKDQI